MGRLTKVEDLSFGRGILTFAPFDANGVLMGERDLGEVDSFALSGEVERITKYSSRTGTSTVILDAIIRVTLSGTLNMLDMSLENQALFLAASVSTKTQAATPIINERIYNAETNRYYQLGESDSNPGGVRVVTSVTIGVYELVNAAARADSTAYTVGQIFKSTTNVFLVTTAGTSAGSAPSFVTTSVGSATTDGTAVVKFIGTTGNYTVTTDYSLDSDIAKVGIVEDGALGLACDLYFATTGAYLSLNAGYTPAANSRKQARTDGSASITGRLFFQSTASIGTKKHVLISSASLGASGESQYITADDTQAFQLSIGVNSKNDTVPQILVDGVPYT